MSESSSSSEFVGFGSFSHQWSDITLLQKRSRNIIYSGVRFSRRFILKTLRPEHCNLTDYRNLHEKEFNLGVSLNHPNIAATYSYEQVQGLGWCIVQEYIDGVPLAEWLENKPSASARERVLMQLLDALDYLHSRQLVHHDLKSGNILVTRNGQNVKLIDFGLSDTDDAARFADSISEKNGRTNDPREDFRRLAPLLEILFPHRYFLIKRRCEHGAYPNIAALRHDLQFRKNIVTLLPVALSILLLAASALVSLHSTREIEQRNETLVESSRQLKEAQEVLFNSIDTTAIVATIDSILMLLEDSLQLPDAEYQEIAQAYFSTTNYWNNIYFSRLAERYPVGTVQYSAFMDTWLFFLNQKLAPWQAKINSLPSFSEAYRNGQITLDEYKRLGTLFAEIGKRNKQ